MFHVNQETGEVGNCEAKKGGCPFGNLDAHYTTAEAARYAYEQTMADKAMGVSKKRPPVDADLSQYDKFISNMTSPEVYVHPQGKVIIYDNTTDVMWVYKNGKPAKTSGTINDMRAGRGAWKQADISGLNPKSASKIDSKAEYEAKRKAELMRLSLPADSQLDPLKPSPFTMNWRRNESHFSPQSASAILGDGLRLNPHESNIEDNVVQDYWGNFKFDASGKKTLVSGPVFEVWKDMDSGRYRFVTTSGMSLTEMGSKGFFKHSQSWNRIGNRSEMVGAFEAQPGGAMIGDVPNKSATAYTYK